MYMYLNFDLEGAPQFPSGKVHIYEENVNFYGNLVHGTTAKAQGTTWITVGSLGYVKTWMYTNKFTETS